jgi:hypothetical protein
VGIVHWWPAPKIVGGLLIDIEDHFTHEVESPWQVHFKHSHWWRRRSRSKFASHYAWGTNGVYEWKMDVKSTWIHTWHQMGHVSWSFGMLSKPPLGSRPNTKLGDHGTLNAHTCWCILFYHGWGPARIEIHRNSIWLRAWSHMIHTTLEGPWPYYMILEVSWTAFGHLLLGSHNFMFTALGLCAKWP